MGQENEIQELKDRLNAVEQQLEKRSRGIQSASNRRNHYTCYFSAFDTYWDNPICE